MSVGRGVQKPEDAGPRPLGLGTAGPVEIHPAPRYISCQIWSFDDKRKNHNYVFCREYLAPRVAPFKVIQGLWNRNGSMATYDFLLVIHSNGPIWYRYRDKRRFWSKTEKLLTSV